MTGFHVFAYDQYGMPLRQFDVVEPFDLPEGKTLETLEAGDSFGLRIGSATEQIEIEVLLFTWNI